MNAHEATLALNLLPKLGPITTGRLLERFGSARAILHASTQELRQVQGMGPELAKQVRNWEQAIDLSAELDELQRRGLHFISRDDARYPAPLKEIHDPPLGLYLWGELTDQDRHAIAVVGARNCTSYGVSCARKLSFQLAHAGVTIISGLARGIDTAAHEGAIAAGGRTIAVIGSGLAQIYPPENLPLARRIAEGHGAVVSEFPLHRSPNKNTFPLRNRIVSGWSRGVLVVEAPERSGSLITANLAAEQGRSVYAVPGPIDRGSAAGCNQLIKDGARLVTEAGDILEEFQHFSFHATLKNAAPATKTSPEGGGQNAPSKRPVPNLSDHENALLKALGDEPMSCDELVEKTGLPAFQVTTALMQLELKSQVQALAGSRYRRVDPSY